MRNMMRPDGDYNFAEWIMQRIDAEWPRYWSAAGIDGASHDFRHTYAVELLKAGVDIRKVSNRLRKNSIRTLA